MSSYLDNALQQKCREAEGENMKLKDALGAMQVDFKELLKEIDRLRKQLGERDQHIEAMGKEMKVLPSLVETTATQKLL